MLSRSMVKIYTISLMVRPLMQLLAADVDRSGVIAGGLGCMCGMSGQPHEAITGVKRVASRTSVDCRPTERRIVSPSTRDYS